jgi:hypothetical protein
MRLDLSVRIFFIVPTFLLNLQAVVLSQTPASDARPGTASISGRVNIGGQPAVGIRVLIADVNTGWGTPDIGSGGSGTQGRKYFSAVTDADSQYRLTGLPAGAYEVSVNLLGVYVPVSQDGQLSRAITLDEGEEARSIDFTLARGGVITGRLTDAGGTPIIGACVLANTINRDGIRSLEWGSLHNRKGKTDDRGVYRIYGLPTDRYRVSADGSEIGPHGGTWRNSGKRYLRVYHPNIVDEKQATIVEVKEASEVAGVDINLGTRRAMYEVSGRVVDAETGKSLSQGQVHSQLLGPEGYPAENFQVSAKIDSQGKFRFAGLPSGRYGMEFFEAFTESEYYPDKTIVEVKQNKVSDIEVKAKKWGAIKGELVVDASNNQALTPQLAYAKITPEIEIEEGGKIVFYSSSSGDSEIGIDNSFSLSKLKPGIVHLRTSGPNPRPYILRIERSGIEIPNGIKVKSGEVIDGIRLVVAYGKGIIRGQISVVGGALPEGAKFKAFAYKPDPFAFHGEARVNRKGQFVFEGLMDGAYEIGVSSVPSKETEAPSHFSRRRVRVIGGAEARVTLTLDLSKKKKEWR